MVEYHFQVGTELDTKVSKYRNAYGFNKSDGARHLLELGVRSSEIEREKELLLEMNSKMFAKLVYLIDLVEKLYSDLEITNDSNPKDNKVLQDFKLNRYKDKYND